MLAGWDMGVIKLADAAMAIAIMNACGDSPISMEVFRTMGAMSTTRAAVGTKHVAKNVNATRPVMTALGPNGPTRLTTPSAISLAAPV